MNFVADLLFSWAHDCVGLWGGRRGREDEGNVAADIRELAV